MRPVFRLQAPSLIAARIRKSRSGKVEVHREFRWGQALNVVISWQILIRTPSLFGGGCRADLQLLRPTSVP